MDPLTMAAISAGATALGSLPKAIPSRYDREQKKRLQELERRQEMGLLGLTEAERAQIESSLRGPREQAQRRSDAEIARLSSPTVQPGQQLMAAQMGAESRQRLEADLASQILGLDLQKKAQEEADIEALRAGQELKRQERINAALAPIQSAAESYVGQMGLERLINVSNMTPQQRQTYLQNDLQLGPEEAQLLEPDGLFSRDAVMPNLEQSSVSQSTTQPDGLFPRGASMPNLGQSSVEEIYNLTETQQQMLDDVYLTLINQGNPKSKDEIIKLFQKYTIHQGDLRQIYRIMDMLNKKGLDVTIDEAIRVYRMMPMYNQDMDIPIDQVSMINQTAFPALSGRTNVLNSRGEEL